MRVGKLIIMHVINTIHVIVNLFLETQTEFIEVCHVGVQCDLLCPAPTTDSIPVTSTPTKSSTLLQLSEADISDINDFDDDVNTTVDATESTEYHDSSSSITDLDNSLPADKQPTYLVFESALMLLFSTCFICKSKFVTVEKLMFGSLLRIKQACSQCSNIFDWFSQPYIGKVPAGNVLLSAAILYTSCLPAKALRMFKTLNCAAITRKTYFRHQNSYLQPAISLVWERHQRKLVSELMIEKKGLVLAGDGRADSPGHSAKYGSYSIIDIKKNKVVDVKLVQVTHANNNVCMHTWIY